MRRHGYEKIHTFEKALEAEDARFKSLDFKKNNGQYFHNFLYYESGKYGEQIQRYMNLFDRNQFLFLSFEELSQNPTITLSKVCDFLEIPAFGFKSLIHSNKGYGIKYPLLDSFIRSKLISNKISYKLKLHTTLQSFNKMDIQPIKKETRMKLMKAYANDLELLFELTGLRIT